MNPSARAGGQSSDGRSSEPSAQLRRLRQISRHDPRRNCVTVRAEHYHLHRPFAGFDASAFDCKTPLRAMSAMALNPALHALKRSRVVDNCDASRGEALNPAACV